ncbi:hypothetical protein [uncultured Psychroserpens sp.]|uniref:hypothetical protein n=1 Tax=uncultured Psychroserpens sp. TaxID=255436 RepID=UPI00260933B6|nr:hypothetical protein [uncultured Psychroserpens sp.]
MTHLHKHIITIAITVITLTVGAQSKTSITIDELSVLDNTQWTGELMYVNYNDSREVTLKTTMQIQIKGHKILMSTQYDNEPSANSKSTIKLKKNGTYFGNEKIIKKHISEDGKTTLTTFYEGRDANKLAKIYKTYVYDGNNFSVTKEVQFNDDSEKFVRNRYTYTKL